MIFKKPRFYNLLSEGRSLVFVPTRSMALAVVHTINHTATIQNVAWCVSPQHPFQEILEELDNAPAHLGVLVLHPAQAGHGFRIQVDRVVWVGMAASNPVIYGYAEYAQSMSRGDFPQHGYTPAKWHYHENEVV